MRFLPDYRRLDDFFARKLAPSRSAILLYVVLAWLLAAERTPAFRLAAVLSLVVAFGLVARHAFLAQSQRAADQRAMDRSLRRVRRFFGVKT